MTKENILRLYEHYKAVGYTAAQLDVEKKRPWVLDSVKKDISKDIKNKKEK